MREPELNWKKYGLPNKAKLAKEIMDLLRGSLQIAIYYGVEKELEVKINESYEKMKAEGLIHGFLKDTVGKPNFRQYNAKFLLKGIFWRILFDESNLKMNCRSFNEVSQQYLSKSQILQRE